MNASAHIPRAALGQHVIVLGKTRSGKSSTLRLLVESLLDDSKPVCIVDPKGDWWGLKSSASGKRAGYPVIIFGGEHADVPITGHAGAYVAELVATGNRPCIIDLGGWMVSDRTRFFVDFASALFKHTRGPRWLVIDECHNFAPQGRIMDPDAGKMLHWANRLASEGAGKGVTLFSASQRPQKVHKDYVTSHETLIAMRVVHPLDRRAVEDWMAGCPDPGKAGEILRTLASMKRGQGWVWSPELGFGPVCIQFPLFKTYDSFAAPVGEHVAKLAGWASVDLDDVKTKLAAVVEEAKANDPRALRAEIATLKAQLQKAPKNITENITDPHAIEGAERRGFSRGKIEGYRVALVECAALANGLASTCEKAGVVVGAARVELGAAIDAARSIERWSQRPTPKLPDAPAVAQFEERIALHREIADANAIPLAPEPPAEGLTPAKQRILDSLAWREAMGDRSTPKETIAFLADASPRSGAYGNNLGALRSAGYLDYPAAGLLALTDAGRRIARPPDHAMTHTEVMRAVNSKLAPALQRVLAGAVAVYPEAIDKTALAERAGASGTSGAYGNNLGRLRSLGLITYPMPGKVRADDRLYP